MYKLVFYPDDRLIHKTKPVVEFNQELNELLDNMKTIMLENNGMGISGNQVGSNLSIFLMKEIKTGDIKEFINPVIKEKNGHQLLDEGCLSFPKIYVQIPRAREVTFEAQDRTGEKKEYVVQDLEAVCVQHEIGHLHGEIFLDLTTRQQRKAAFRKIEKYAKNH